MLQLLQNVSTGDITLQEVPAPARENGALLVATRFSVISAGTERAVMAMGNASLVGKARARPDLVKKVLASAQEDGPTAAIAKVRGRLGEPNPVGYSLCGTVLEACDGAPAGRGDLVACGGAGLATHAEIVSVPRLLCARVPENVSAENAAYTTIAAIALHGVRLTGVGLGDVVAVVGLGLVGQLTMDLVRAAGGVALGVDPVAGRVELARASGYFATTEPRDLDAECRRLTQHRGADGVLVTAASKSTSPLATALQVARERSVCCVVGDVPIKIPRAAMFAKEVQLVVSRSYGPGRYDPAYERAGHDYPAGYVRWTEGRNFEEVLRLMATGQLSPSRLTTHTVELSDGVSAYDLLTADEAALGILLRYPGGADPDKRSRAAAPAARRRPARRSERPRLGMIGAGMFARSVLLPMLSRQADIVAIATSTGHSAQASATRFGAGLATTDPDDVLLSPDVDAVVIATRHDTHADYVTRALAAGKHVFVEKPLALSEGELAAVEAACAVSGGVLMVGFNRRFSAHVRDVRAALGGRGPLIISYRVNAGRVPRGDWTRDPVIGGGRIVGETGHFVDVAAALVGGHPSLVSAVALAGGAEAREDAVAATLAFEDGSIAQLIYSAVGDPSLPKERFEVLSEVGAAVCEDYRELTLFTGGKRVTTKGTRDKGHKQELAAFVSACRTGVQPWPVADMAAVTRATFALRDAIGAVSR